MAELTYTRVFDAPHRHDQRRRRMLLHPARRPEDQARFLTSLDRFAAYLETLVCVVCRNPEMSVRPVRIELRIERSFLT
jgi:hypothetical protein